MARSKPLTLKEHRSWRRVLVVLQALGFSGLLVSYWRITWLVVTFAAFDPTVRGTLTTLDGMVGLFIGAFIVVEGWAVYALLTARPVAGLLLWISFGCTIGLGLFTISTAPLLANVVFFMVAAAYSGAKLFIFRQLVRLQPQLTRS